jgi:hypothetical protein
VYNNAGQLMPVAIQGGNGQVVVGVAALPTGVYFLRIGSQTIAFVKK